MKSKENQLRTVGALALAGALMLVGQPVFATFKPALGLTNFNPDLQATALDLSYAASTGVMTISGTGVSGTFTDVDGNFAGGGLLNYTLSVTFENDGASLLATASNTLSITAASQWNINSQTIDVGQVMLDGDIYNFGIAGTGSSGTFEFLTENLSSDVDGILGWNLSGFSQVIATASSISTGDASWLVGNVDFSASTVVADNSVSAVPLPATLALMAFGVAGISVVRHRRGLLVRATEKRT
ncbi:PEP-CTERM sorting domain-containing protein [Thiohalocapsa sp. ML1]|uniref:PEP-CTERM sorting domain-containing protein n=1 Tax=Thiohalocapsa sp. ML1 TaxID=1431688 RepID=UPI00138F436C|nr:PEP-CTERM sorting domain-containing protein [Thiohalocapsa sp. ML1]